MHLPARNPFLTISFALLCASSVIRAADALQLGRAALSDRQPAAAERHLVGYLATNQGNPEKCPAALLLLLHAVSDQGRPADVLALLEANPDIVSNAPPVKIAYWRARSLLELGRSSQALSVAMDLLPAAAAAAAIPAESPRPADLDEKVGDYALLLRIQARALAETPGQAAKAAKAFQTADDLLTSDHLPSMKAANLYEWARLASVTGDPKGAEELLGRLESLSPFLTNGPALPLEEGLLLKASLLIEDGRGVQAVPLLQGLATNGAATLRNRAEAVLSLVTLSVQEERHPALQAPEPLLPAPGDYAGTIETFSKELPSDRAWEINRRFGRLLLSATSSIPVGASILSRTIREKPSSPESPSDHLAIADAWLSISSNGLAAAEYQSFLEAYQGSPAMVLAARRGQATALMRRGDYDEAATLFQKVADASTDADLKAACLLEAARSLRSGRKFKRAAALFLQAADTPSTTNDESWVSSVRFDAADALERATDLKAAREAFLEVAANGLPPLLADKALYRAALICDRAGDRPGAIAAYSDLIERTKDDKLANEARLGRGRDYYGDFKFTAAIDDFSSISPDYPALAAEAAYYRLFCLYATNRDEEAVRCAEQFIQDRPDSFHLPAITLWLAQYHYNRHDYTKAQKIFSSYAKRWPDSPDTAKALLWGATAAFEQAEYQQSIDLLALLLRSFPASPFAGEARFLQAKALCNLARYEEAILALNDVINRYPAGEFIPDAWILLGDARFSSSSSGNARKRYGEATEAYAAALARCKTIKAGQGTIPDDGDFNRFIEASYKIGRCMEKNGDLAKARDHYYENVITPYLEAVQKGAFPNAEASTWFARAILQSADLLEHEGNLEGAISVLAHLEGIDLPERDQAERMTLRLKKARLR